MRKKAPGPQQPQTRYVCFFRMWLISFAAWVIDIPQSSTTRLFVNRLFWLTTKKTPTIWFTVSLLVMRNFFNMSSATRKQSLPNMQTFISEIYIQCHELSLVLDESLYISLLECQIPDCMYGFDKHKHWRTGCTIYMVFMTHGGYT